LISLWLMSTVIFIKWWFAWHHILTMWAYGLNTFLVLWSVALPGYFFYFLMRMKIANPKISVLPSWRVAMVVTRAPNEPFELVKKTLLAMQNQDFPLKYDVWLADECPNEEIYEWCCEYDILISSRMGVSDYHRLTWPRRTKCKEGNLAYFYDMYGYERYDFVAQLDADHIPEKDYLKAMMRPFIDNRVGYVSAPSICDNNADESWAARARLYAEGSLHGPLQAGYSNNWAPLCIGSHYAVRTKALKEIGGLGPELAEDHSTTLMMNAYGWRGVHALDAIAHGDGPATFSDAMTQEFQWSRSLIVLLLTLTPKVLGKLPIHLKFQFLFAQMWYPIFAMVMLMSWLLPLIAIVTGKPWVNVNYFEFMTFSILPTFFSLLIMVWVKSLKVLRPVDAKIISWEFVLFQFARWPWVLWALVMAVVCLVSNRQIEFKVTPKGADVKRNVPLGVATPYILCSLISGSVVLIGTANPSTVGYYYFGIMNCFVYLLLIAVVGFKKS